MEENENKENVNDETVVIDGNSTNSEVSKKDKKKAKKKLPVGVRIILFPFKLILFLLLVLLVWFIFCYFDRVKSVDTLPPDYAVYLRTDSVWGTAEPLLDLDATLIAMTSPEMQQYRDTYLMVKSSKLRKNFFVKKALQRRLDAAIYGIEGEDKTAAIAVLDAGFLSGAVRVAPYIIPRIKSLSDTIEITSNTHGTYYKLQDTGCFIIKKNLIVFSTSETLLEEAMTFTNSSLYTKEELNAINSRLKNPLRIFANGQNLLALAGEDTMLNKYLTDIIPYLAESEYISLNFGITDKELNVKIEVPVSSEDSDHPVVQLVKRESAVPSLLPKFSEDVQYYTLVSAGTLRSIVDAAAKIIPPEKDFEATWNKSDTVSKIVFNRGLDDLLFSWTADEFAIFGIEGKSEPVFAIKIGDEKKRKEIFDKVFSSYILQTNDSLIVDGVRLPCIKMPGFVLSVLQALNINIPMPYYLVKDDYIYLSQSPENLVAINSDFQNSKKLSGSENWKRVSSKQSPYSTLSLYYNLERSVPFFIKGNSSMSKVLALYNSGRFDLRIKDNVVTVQLQASAETLESTLHIPGFPIELEKKSNAQLVKSNAKKSKKVYWVETDSTVNSLDCGSFVRESLEMPEIQYVVAASESTAKATSGEIWAVTKSGMVYLLNSKLESVLGYPILTGVTMSCPPFAYKDSVVLVGNDGTLCFVSQTGELSTLDTGVESGIKSTPTVNGDVIAFYEKGFFGGIHVYKNLEPVTSEGPFALDGIAYGSPCIFTAGGNLYTAMITQAGDLYVYDFEGKLLEDFPVKLDGIFYLNVEMADGYLFALSSAGELYRVSLDGKTLKVKIPYFTAKTGRITIADYDGHAGQEIFVSGEGNSLYGFSSNMELLSEFPVSGYGNPVFTDLNGDNKNDCLAITFDNKITAANVLRGNRK